MYVIPSSPAIFVSSIGDSEDSVATLAKRVSAYLARVVGALADYEDRLLKEDGFFAREEHFEAQIDSLRREFEGNKRAAVRAFYRRGERVVVRGPLVLTAFAHPCCIAGTLRADGGSMASHRTTCRRPDELLRRS